MYLIKVSSIGSYPNSLSNYETWVQKIIQNSVVDSSQSSAVRDFLVVRRSLVDGGSLSYNESILLSYLSEMVN